MSSFVSLLITGPKAEVDVGCCWVRGEVLLFAEPDRQAHIHCHFLVAPPGGRASDCGICWALFKPFFRDSILQGTEHHCSSHVLALGLV